MCCAHVLLRAWRPLRARVWVCAYLRVNAMVVAVAVAMAVAVAFAVLVPVPVPVSCSCKCREGVLLTGVNVE